MERGPNLVDFNEIRLSVYSLKDDWAHEFLISWQKFPPYTIPNLYKMIHIIPFLRSPNIRMGLHNVLYKFCESSPTGLYTLRLWYTKNDIFFIILHTSVNNFFIYYYIKVHQTINRNKVGK